MPFDETLADRIRQVLGRTKGIAEKKLFGCWCFLLHGNVCVGVWKQSLIARLDSDDYEDALKEPFVKEFDITGRPMKGWVAVEPGGIEDDEKLKDWLRRAVKFAGKLPAK